MTDIFSPHRQSITGEDAQLGAVTRREIYKASANSEVFEMLNVYFADFAHALDCILFGLVF